jgi:hypothetical protein
MTFSIDALFLSSSSCFLQFICQLFYFKVFLVDANHYYRVMNSPSLPYMAAAIHVASASESKDEISSTSTSSPLSTTISSSITIDMSAASPSSLSTGSMLLSPSEMIWTTLWQPHDITDICTSQWLIWITRSSAECSPDECVALRQWATNEARYHGIPAALRSRVWPLLIGSDGYVRKNDGVYATLRSSATLMPTSLAAASTAAWTKKIGRDLDRTYTDTPFFALTGRHTTASKSYRLSLLTPFVSRASNSSLNGA